MKASSYKALRITYCLIIAALFLIFVVYERSQVHIPIIHSAYLHLSSSNVGQIFENKRYDREIRSQSELDKLLASGSFPKNIGWLNDSAIDAKHIVVLSRNAEIEGINAGYGNLLFVTVSLQKEPGVGIALIEGVPKDTSLKFVPSSPQKSKIIRSLFVSLIFASFLMACWLLSNDRSSQIDQPIDGSVPTIPKKDKISKQSSS